MVKLRDLNKLRSRIGFSEVDSQMTKEIREITDTTVREGANKWGNSSRLTQSFHFFMFEPIFSPVNALNQPI